MAATNINLSAAVNSIPVVAVAIATISMSVSYSQPVFGVADVGSSVQIEASIQPTIPLANDFIRPSDDDLKAVSKTLTTTAEESNDVFVTDSDPLKNIQLVKTDSVTAIESRVKVFTDFIDFDPSDDDVDATPVTISESDAKDITVGELADNDEATVSNLLQTIQVYLKLIQYLHQKQSISFGLIKTSRIQQQLLKRLIVLM